VGGLAIPTADKRNEKGKTHGRQKRSVEMVRRKFNGEPDLPFDEKTSMNEGKHDRKTKAKINAEKPKPRVRK
jgi:hypothetical protein